MATKVSNIKIYSGNRELLSLEDRDQSDIAVLSPDVHKIITSNWFRQNLLTNKQFDSTQKVNLFIKADKIIASQNAAKVELPLPSSNPKLSEERKASKSVIEKADMIWKSRFSSLQNTSDYPLSNNRQSLLQENSFKNQNKLRKKENTELINLQQSYQRLSDKKELYKRLYQKENSDLNNAKEALNKTQEECQFLVNKLNCSNDLKEEYKRLVQKSCDGLVQLKEKNEKLQALNKGLQAINEGSKAIRGQLQQKTQHLDNDRKLLYEERITLKQKINTLEEKLKNTKNQLEKSEEENANIEKNKKEVQKTVKKLNGSLQESSDKLGRMQNEKDRLKKLLEKEESSKKHYSELYQKVSSDQAEAQKNLDSARIKIKNLEKNLSNSEQINKNLEQELNQKTTLLATIGQEKAPSAIEKKNQELLKTVTDLQRELTKLKTTKSSLKEDITSSDKKISSLENEITALNANLKKEKETTKSKLKATHSEYEENELKTQKEIENLTKELKNAERALKEKIAIADEKINDLNNKLKKATKINKIENIKNKKANELTANFEKYKKDSEAKLQETTQKVASLTQTLQKTELTKDSEVRKLSNQINQLEKELQEEKRAKEKLQEKETISSKTLEEAETDRNSQESKISLQEKKIEELKQNFEKVQEEVTGTTEIKNENEQLHKELGKVQKSANIAKENLDNLTLEKEKIIQKLNTDLKETQEKKEQLEEEKRVLEDNVLSSRFALLNAIKGKDNFKKQLEELKQNSTSEAWQKFIKELNEFFDHFIAIDLEPGKIENEDAESLFNEMKNHDNKQLPVNTTISGSETNQSTNDPNSDAFYKDLEYLESHRKPFRKIAKQNFKALEEASCILNEKSNQAEETGIETLRQYLANYQNVIYEREKEIITLGNDLERAQKRISELEAEAKEKTFSKEEIEKSLLEMQKTIAGFSEKSDIEENSNPKEEASIGKSETKEKEEISEEKHVGQLQLEEAARLLQNALNKNETSELKSNNIIKNIKKIFKSLNEKNPSFNGNHSLKEAFNNITTNYNKFKNNPRKWTSYLDTTFALIKKLNKIKSKDINTIVESITREDICRLLTLQKLINDLSKDTKASTKDPNSKEIAKILSYQKSLNDLISALQTAYTKFE